MNNPKISVIVPVYNLENYIEKTVATITAQTYKNLEIILIDDGSTDRSLEICQNLAKKDNRIVVIHKENSGVSAARNIGIKLSTGEYIGFCDGDDAIEKDMYEFLYNKLVSDKADISMCSIKMVRSGNSTTLHSTGKNILWNSTEDYLKALFSGNTNMSVNSKLFKADICKNISFDENLRIYEDKYYNFLMAFKANRITCYDVPKYIYFRRKGSSSVMEFSEKFFDGIKISDKMIDAVKKMYPQLSDYAQANKLSTVLRTYTLLCMRNGLKKFPNEVKNIRNYIKNFDKHIAKKYLSKKNYIRYKVAKTNKTLFAFMSKHFEKT